MTATQAMVRVGRMTFTPPWGFWYVERRLGAGRTTEWECLAYFKSEHAAKRYARAFGTVEVVR